MIDHIIHGFMLLMLIIFGVPVLISLAMGMIGTGRANFKAATHVMIASIHVVVAAIEDIAESLAKILAKRYPTQKKVLQPIIKHVLVGLFILVLLALLSVFN